MRAVGDVDHVTELSECALEGSSTTSCRNAVFDGEGPGRGAVSGNQNRFLNGTKTVVGMDSEFAMLCGNSSHGHGRSSLHAVSFTAACATTSGRRSTTSRGKHIHQNLWSLLALLVVALQLLDSSVGTVHAAWHPRLKRGGADLLDIEDIAPIETNFLQVNAAAVHSKSSKPCKQFCKEKAESAAAAAAGQSGSGGPSSQQGNGPSQNSFLPPQQQQQAPMFYPPQQGPPPGFPGNPYYANGYVNAQNQFPQQEATQQQGQRNPTNPNQYPYMYQQQPQQMGIPPPMYQQQPNNSPYYSYPPYGPNVYSAPQQQQMMRPPPQQMVMEQPPQQQPMMVVGVPQAGANNQNNLAMMGPTMMEVASAPNTSGGMQPRLVEVMMPATQQAPQQQFALRGAANNGNPEVIVLSNQGQQTQAQQPALVYEAVPQAMMMAQR